MLLRTISCCNSQIILRIPELRFVDTFCGENFYFEFETPAHTATGGRLELSSHCFSDLQPDAPRPPCSYAEHPSLCLLGPVSPYSGEGHPVHQPFYREALGMLACTHNFYTRPNYKKNGGSPVSYTTPLFCASAASPCPRSTILRPHRLPASSCAGSSCTARSSHPTA